MPYLSPVKIGHKKMGYVDFIFLSVNFQFPGFARDFKLHNMRRSATPRHLDNSSAAIYVLATFCIDVFS